MSLYKDINFILHFGAAILFAKSSVIVFHLTHHLIMAAKVSHLEQHKNDVAMIELGVLIISTVTFLITLLLGY